MKKKILLILPLIGILPLASCKKHEHTYSSAFSYDETNHWHPATCEHKDEVQYKGPHVFGDFEVIKEPTNEEAGLKQAKCTVCGYTKSEEIPFNHVHTYSTDWSYDRTNHWHVATCSHKDLKSNEAVHTFDEWTYVDQATPTSQGRRYKTCSICKYVDEELFDYQYPEGTIQNPFNITKAIEEANKLDVSTYSNKKYYVKGVVSHCYQSGNSFRIMFYTPGTQEESRFFATEAQINTDMTLADYDDDGLIGATVTLYGYLKKEYDSTGTNYLYKMPAIDELYSPSHEHEIPMVVEVTNGTPISSVPHEHTFNTSIVMHDSETHWNPATCFHTNVRGNEEPHTFDEWVIDTPATTTKIGKKHKTCPKCSYTVYEDIPMVTGDGTFTLYTFNDFHGAVNEYSSSSHIGLAKFATYLKNVSSQPNTMIIDSGDTFQGSIESNYNNGAMITDVFNYAHVDVHTLGNHDFDWGMDKITANKAKSASDGWHMTNLAANIYDYNFSTKVEGNVHQSQLGDKYYIKTLDNGLRVGVVGVIGSDQITSICSPLVETICFKAHIQVLKNLSDELRTSKGCDIVIASIHASAEDTMGKGLTEVSSISQKKYFDYVACAHSHYNEKYTENDVYYTQASAYGERMYKSTFTVSKGNITNCVVEDLNYSTITNSVTTVDSNISNIIASYAKDYSSIGSTVVASSTSGTFYKNNHMPNLLCKAMYTEARKQGYTVDMACTNDARYNVTGSSWTYSTLYEAFPFDNTVYIAKIKGSKNVKELCNYNYRYHNSSLTSMDYNTWYTVAVIDYLLFHTNSSRDYDYFSFDSSNMQIIGSLKKANGDTYIYRDICSDYVKTLSGTIYASDYNKTLDEFKAPSIPSSY